MKHDSIRNSSILLPLIVLSVLTIATQLMGLIYGVAQTGRSIQTVIIPSTIVLAFVTVPLAGLGLLLGPRTGLGAPLLIDLLRNAPGAQSKFLKSTILACLLGLAFGAAMVVLRIALQSSLPPEMPAYGHHGALGGLLVSLGAAVGEEVWFRLGLMTILVWAVSRLLGQRVAHSGVVWTIIVLAAVAFGMAHLPQLASFEAATPFSIWATILGNTLVGILYGWLYWRHGILAAIFGHFSVDIVIHVLPALV
tara:strand:- start:971 stop:1723 length:753 start_codon:yes stop_codon:yes gene_type:complete